MPARPAPTMTASNLWLLPLADKVRSPSARLITPRRSLAPHGDSENRSCHCNEKSAALGRGAALRFRPRSDDLDVRRVQRHARLNLRQGEGRGSAIGAEVQSVVSCVEVEETRVRLELSVTRGVE